MRIDSTPLGGPSEETGYGCDGKGGSPIDGSAWSAGGVSAEGAGVSAEGAGAAGSAAGASAGTAFSSAAGAAASGRGAGLPLLLRMKAMTLARFLASGMPGKTIVVPTAKAWGLVIQVSSSS